MTAAWLQQWQMSRRCARSRTRDSSTLTTEWNGMGHTAWMAAIPLNLSNHPTHVVLVWAAHDQLDQERQSEDSRKHAMHYGITTEFCLCNKSFVFVNSEMETCWESCIIHFPTKPPCSTRVDVLETGNVPILFSVPQMKNLGMTDELDLKGDKLHVLLLACTLLQLNTLLWDI